MLAIPITVNLFVLFGCFAFSVLLGFAFRSSQIKSLKNKLAHLEKELLETHAEILDLQRTNVGLEEKLKGTSSIPVIPINTVAEEKGAEKVPDVSIRKKLLQQKSAEKHS